MQNLFIGFKEINTKTKPKVYKKQGGTIDKQRIQKYKEYIKK